MKTLYFIGILWLCVCNSTYGQSNLIPIKSSSNASPSDVESEKKEIEVNSNQAKKFVPTEEWQMVEDGQSIPAGLHVRINLSTGLKEAKLMDKKTLQSESVTRKSKISSTLEEALKNIATSHDEPSGNTEKVQNSTSVKQKFKSIEEIKKYFDDVNATMTSEMDIVTGLLTRLHSLSDINSESLESLLYELEFYLHQFDNAEYFASVGGMAILTKIVGSTPVLEVERMAVLAVGAACQSNEKVARAAAETKTAIGTSLPEYLLDIIALRREDTLMRASLFALSTIVRAYPRVWETLSSSGTLNELMSCQRTLAVSYSMEIAFLSRPCYALNRSAAEDESVSVKVKVKIVTIITDLLDLASSAHDSSTGLADILAKTLTYVKPNSLCKATTSLLMPEKLSSDHADKIIAYFQKYCINRCAQDATLSNNIQLFADSFVQSEDIENSDESLSHKVKETAKQCRKIFREISSHGEL